MEWLLSRCESLGPDEFYEIKESHNTKNSIIDNVIQIDNQNKIKKPTKLELNKLVEKFSKSSHQSNALRITKKKRNTFDLSRKESKKTENIQKSTLFSL
jgi:BRCT domain type II-containing protein